MNRADTTTHHHSALAGVSAGATAVLAGSVLILVAARRQLGEVATVIVWAVAAAVVGAVIAAAVYVFLWLRHRVQHPETLAGRRAVRSEVAMDDAPATPVPVAAGNMAAIEPPRAVHLHFHTADPSEAAEIIRQALPGAADEP